MQPASVSDGAGCRVWGFGVQGVGGGAYLALRAGRHDCFRLPGPVRAMPHVRRMVIE